MIETEEPWRGTYRESAYLVKLSAEALQGIDTLSPQEEESRRIFRVLDDPEEMGRRMVTRAAENLAKNFDPVTVDDPGRNQRYTFRLVGDLEAEEPRDPRDYGAIRKAIMEGKTYGSRVRGTFEVVREKDGKEEVLDRRTMTVAQVPTPLYDRTFLVDGKSRFLPYQFRRNAGAFTRYNEAGELLTEFNLDPFTSSPVPNFNITFDRGTADKPAQFYFRPAKSQKKKVSAWELARILGADESDLRRAVGADLAKDIAAGSSDASLERTIRSVYSEIEKTPRGVHLRGRAKDDNVSVEELRNDIRTFFGTAGLDPEITRDTLGVAAPAVTKEAILQSFRKLRDVANEDAQPDDRDAIYYKKVMAPEDLLAEAVGRDPEVSAVQRNIRSSLRQVSRMEADPKQKGKQTKDYAQIILGRQRLNQKLAKKLTTSMVHRDSDSVNPLDSLNSASMTTLMGEGAISSPDAVPFEAKLVNPSTIGFLDLVDTPGSNAAGTTLYLSANAKARRSDPKTPKDTGASELTTRLLTRSGKEIEVSPLEMKGKTVGAFDQIEVINGKVFPKGKTVRAFRDGQPVEVRSGDVDYWMPSQGNLFDINSLMTPYGNSTQGNRIQYAVVQAKSSVPMSEPEKPLVKVRAPGSQMTMEELVGVEAGALRAGFDGVVVEAGDRADSRFVKVKNQETGATKTYELPKVLPLAGKTPLDSRLRVQKGQKVKRGDVLADSNFTEDGEFALGKNLRVAYLPFKAATFEDAIAISESAAQKMTSQHLYKEHIARADMKLGKKAYETRGTPLSKEHKEALDDRGVIKVGQRVVPGQPIVVGLRGLEMKDDEWVKKAALLGTYGSQNKRSLKGKTTFFRQDWKNDFPGVVTDVKVKNTAKGPQVSITVQTDEPMQVGDKIFGRHGNKGVIAAILPDEEMPRNPNIVEVVNPAGTQFFRGQEISREEAQKAADADPQFEFKDAPVEVMLNPLGVPSRMNPSQNFETFMGKLARRTGQEVVADNFSHESNWQHVKDELEKAGISDAEDLVDPVTGRTIPNVGVGTQYILKAKHTVQKKGKSARSVGNFQKSGLVSKGEDGAQALGELGLYGLLAQDAREVLRDAQLYKSENREEVWDAVRRGDPLPPVFTEPQAFLRFQDYLRAAGVQTVHDKANHKYRMVPMTDDDVVKLARTAGKDNVLTSPWETLTKNTGVPKPGGLFDPDAVGGFGGNKWTRFELAQALPNPIYEKAIKSLINVRDKQFDEILAGRQEVEIGDETFTGAKAVEMMLKNVNLDEEYAAAERIARNEKDDSKRSKAYRKLKTINMLRENKMSPDQAFLRRQVSVPPAMLRGIQQDEAGDMIIGDLNYLYRDVALTNREIEEARKNGLPAKAIGELEAGLYDTMRTLMQTEGSAPMSGDFQGITGILTGQRWEGGQKAGSHKDSLLKKELVQRRQTFSARTVLTPDETLDLDEAAIPKTTAAVLVEPEIMKQWRRDNPRATVDQVQDFRQKLIDYQKKGKKDYQIERYLENAARGQNVLLKRDPVLHKYGFQGFKMKLTDRDTLSMHPAVFGGFSADVDGDTMAIFRPLTQQANREIEEKLLPSKNLFNPTSGTLEFTLGHEALLGLSSLTTDPKKKTGKSFPNLAAAQEAYNNQEIDVSDEITIAGIKTTLGRARVNAALPAGVSLDTLQKDGVLSPKKSLGLLDKGNTRKMMEHIAIKHPAAFGEVTKELRLLGQDQATFMGASLLLDDLKPLLVEDRQKLQKQLEDRIQKIQNDRSLTPQEKEEAISDLFEKVLDAKDKESLTSKARTAWDDTLKGERPNTLTAMVSTGARANWDQLKQITVAPTALVDGKGRVVPSPVMKNYSEGLDATSYAASAHGVRMGAVNKVVEVQEPGYLSKQVLNTTMDTIVTEADCGTSRSVVLDLTDNDLTRDLVGRTLAGPLKAGSVSRRAGEQLTMDDISEVRRGARGRVQARVRSPLKCESTDGVCQACAGGDPGGQLLQIGTNVGILAGQSMGERSVQLALSTFHGGGVFVPGQRGADNLYQQAQALLRMPGSMDGKPAVISNANATVKEVKENKTKGGWDIVTEEDSAPNFFVPRSYRAPDNRTPISRFFRPGDRIRRGQRLSSGMANPKDVLEATGDLEATQDYMTESLHDLFKNEGVMRRNVETVVRSMTNVVEIRDPGGSHLLPGQRIPKPQAESLKKDYPGLSYSPILRGVDVSPREQREDFLARLNFNHLRSTLTDSATIGAETDYHSTHPIPALVTAFQFGRAGRRERDRGYY